MSKILVTVLFFMAFFWSGLGLAKTTEQRLEELQQQLDAIQKTYLSNNAEVASSLSRSEGVEQEFAILKGAVEANSHLIESQRQDLMRIVRDLEQRQQAMEDRMEMFSSQIANALKKIAPEVAMEGELYQAALNKTNRGEYLSAAADFQSFIKKYPKSNFASSAQFWIGECFFSIKDFKRAIKEYQVFIQTYPRNEKAPAAILKQGIGFLELGMIEESKPFFEKVRKDYPGSPEAAQANIKLQQATQRKAAGVKPAAANVSPGTATAVKPAATTGGVSGDTAAGTAGVAGTDGAAEVVSKPFSSYPEQTIEQQRSKYNQTPVTGVPIQDKTTSEPVNKRYNDF